MKKILVIGGAGYIGSHVVFELMNADYSPVILDDLSSGDRQNLFSENEFIHGNFLDETTLQKIPANIDAVIHLAALKAAGESMLLPEKYANHNINGFVSLLDHLCKKNIKKIVFSSSAAVYGIPEYLPIDENHSTRPINFYGYTKLFGEQILQWYSELKGMQFISLRYFNAVGYDLKKKDFALEKKPNNLFPILMEAVSGKRSVIEIFGDDYETPDGTCTRDYIHVSDLAQAHILSVRSLIENSENLVLNLGTDCEISVKEAVETALRLFNPKVPVKICPRRPGDPGRLFANSSYARKKLNWKPKIIDLKVILQSMYEIR